MLYVIALLVLALDQGIKWLVRTHMALHSEIPVVPSVLEIDYIRNPGAAWGILTNARGVLIVIALVVIAVVVWLDRKYRPTWWTRFALGLVLGGAIGNLLDRAISGTVVDYIYVSAINFPVFNLADSAIVVGVILLLWRNLFSKENTRKDEEGSR